MNFLSSLSGRSMSRILMISWFGPLITGWLVFAAGNLILAKKMA
uniref:Uncharacterized protein n=1 Tax=Rhizophora mucronata TaxID=61149 RepID=A0A2P2IIP3_RHIMU